MALLKMPTEPSASDIFDDLCNQANSKFATALNRIRGACDALVTANATISYSQVGKIATQLYGGPKTQSILKNSKHKSYIDARRLEQLVNKPKAKPGIGAKYFVEYPSNDLDYKTRRYIDDLRNRNSMLELAMRELKTHVLAASENCTLDMTQMITAGAQPDASMGIKLNSSNARQAALIETLKELMDDLCNKVPEVESYMGKGIRLRTGEWLLAPDLFSLIKSLIDS